MKVFLYTLIGFMLQLFTLQSVAANNYNASIFGTIQKDKCEIVYLYGYKTLADFLEGKIILDSSIVSNNGAYRFDINIPRPTEFVIKDNTNGYITFGLYVSPGDSLEFSLESSKENETITIDGKGHKFNSYLKDLVNKFYLDNISRETYSSSFKLLNTEEFTQYIDNRKDEQLQFFNDCRIKSGDFSDALIYIAINEIKLKWAIDKIQYLWKHTYMNKKEGDVQVNSAYYSFLNQIDLNDSNLVWLPGYHRYILTKLNRDYLNLRLASIGTENEITVKESKCQNLLKAKLISDTVKGINRSLAYALLINNELQRSNVYSPSTLDSLWNLYESNLVDTNLSGYLKNKIDLFKYKLYYEEPIDFKLIDLNGDTVKLSDFRGMLVYLDFWSTSCAPCIKEIPYSNDLQEKLKDENLIFLNISFDRSQEKWEKLIESKKWVGIHLIANNLNDDEYLKRTFNFNGFPHYAIVDEQGKIIDINATRPSGNIYEKIYSLLENNKIKNNADK